MPLAVILSLYAFILIYAGATYWLGEALQLLTVIVGFGLPILLYLALEWVAPPLVALAMGFQARWSPTMAVALGLPLLVLFTVVTPVIGSGNSSLPVPVPWLSVFAKGKAEVAPIILERLVWWGGVYAAALLAGHVSRRLRPLQGSPADKQ